MKRSTNKPVLLVLTAMLTLALVGVSEQAHARSQIKVTVTNSSGSKIKVKASKYEFKGKRGVFNLQGDNKMLPKGKSLLLTSGRKQYFNYKKVGKIRIKLHFVCGGKKRSKMSPYAETTQSSYVARARISSDCKVTWKIIKH